MKTSPVCFGRASGALFVALCLVGAGCGKSPEGGTPEPSGMGGRSSGSGGRAAGGQSGGSGGSGAAGENGGGSGSGGKAAGSGGSGNVGSGGSSGSGGSGAGGSGGGTDGGTPSTPADAAGAPNPDLDKACTPGVELKLSDKGPNGKLFTDAAKPTPEAFLQQIGRAVCRVLYRDAKEVRNATHLELLIQDDPGVAWKAGDGADITVMISTRHLANVQKGGGDVAYEISGILHHEMTHMYQHDDTDGKGVDLGLIEGIADFVRLNAGFPAKHWGKPSRGGSWKDGYTTTAFFLDWADKKYPDLVYKLNLTMDSKDGKKWAPETFKEITGKTVDELWTEYQAALK